MTDSTERQRFRLYDMRFDLGAGACRATHLPTGINITAKAETTTEARDLALYRVADLVLTHRGYYMATAEVRAAVAAGKAVADRMEGRSPWMR